MSDRGMILRALTMAQDKLNGCPAAQTPHDVRPGHFQALCHARWMIDQIRGFVEVEEYDKANRWLGFVQGVVWVVGFADLNELRAANRSTKSILDDLTAEAQAMGLYDE